MSDDKGALELLEEVLRCDDPLLKVEAEKLMKQLD
jgi:pilus assembly protein FimV